MLGSTHERVRRLRRLGQNRSDRWEEEICVLEGPDLVDAALSSGATFEAIFVDEEHVSKPVIAALIERAQDAKVRVFSLASGVLEKVADAKTPQPIIATVSFPLTSVSKLPADGFALVLHELKDPGNAGTIIRSADASGASCVVFTGNSVDVFNPKVLRATAGSVFHLPIAVAPLSDVLAHFKSAGVTSYATVIHGGASPRSVDLSKASVVVIGNESAGLDDEAIALCDASLSIPMDGDSESLNAGIAASLIAFEALNQRQDAKSPSKSRSLKE